MLGAYSGLATKARLVALIRGKATWIEHSGQRDVHGRTLAALRVGGPSGVSVGMKLEREGLALPWKPGADAKEKRRLYWCGPDGTK